MNLKQKHRTSKFKERLRIRFQKMNLCAGCLSCVTVCSLHTSDRLSLDSSRIRIELDPFGGKNIARVCQQCEKPKCAERCPKDAINKDDLTGVVTIVHARCDGCRECLDACPFNAIFWDEADPKIIKCDTCDGEPACVAACKFGVLTYE